MTRHLPESRSIGERPVTLAHRRIHAPGTIPSRWVLFLHGFLGAGRNWASIGRGVVEARPDWGVVLVDLRLHGDSQGLAPPHTVAASAGDVNALILRLQATETVIVGHSFGGKVALAAARAGDPTLKQVWVMDSTPSAGRTEAGADRLLALLGRLPERFDDRGEVVRAVQGAGFNLHIAEWTATNLARGPDGYRWKFDLAALDLLLEDFYREDLWSVVEPSVPGREVIFVRATRASIMDEAAAARIARMEADGECVRLVSLDGGHWINMENPDAVLELLIRHLPR
ncbi:MAG: alpha/beta hydrolase [marine benthic group bacterium]|nr:alpha/beta hydrolase [Gemmatimonadota bacterium]